MGLDLGITDVHNLNSLEEDRKRYKDLFRIELSTEASTGHSHEMHVRSQDDEPLLGVISYDEQGRRHGLARSMRPDGAREQTAYYTHGQLEDVYEYTKTNKLLLQTPYQDAVPHGITYYYPNHGKREKTYSLHGEEAFRGVYHVCCFAETVGMICSKKSVLHALHLVGIPVAKTKPSVIETHKPS